MKLSIILPIYNVEKFLPDCFASLETQDIPKEEYEIICVDDGSPDNSAAVIEEYQKKYPNIRLIRQANGGVCSARNNGLKAALGEYIWYVDPDDYIQANCLGILLDKLYASEADFIVFEYDEVAEESAFNIEDQSDIIIEAQEEYSSKGSGCQYIVRRAYLEENNIAFNDKLAYGEDYLWAFQLNYRKHVGLKTSARIYHYRQRVGSAMHGRTREKQLRHMNDMQLLATIYQGEYQRCEREELPTEVLKNIKQRQQLCMQCVILDLIRLVDGKTEIKAKLNELQEEGLYPYPWMWWYLFDKSIQAPFSAKLFSLFFPMRWYVVLMNKLFKRKG